MHVLAVGLINLIHLNNYFTTNTLLAARYLMVQVYVHQFVSHHLLGPLPPLMNRLYDVTELV